MILKILLIVLIFVLGILYYLFPRILVVGVSMFPTYEDNEILWAQRVFNRNKLKVNDVVVLKFKTVEDGRHKVLIKRISDIEDNKIYVLGDNSKESYDSRDFGFIPIEYVIARPFDQRNKEN